MGPDIEAIYETYYKWSLDIFHAAICRSWIVARLLWPTRGKGLEDLGIVGDLRWLIGSAAEDQSTGFGRCTRMQRDRRHPRSQGCRPERTESYVIHRRIC